MDFRIDFYAVWAPTWSPLGLQVGAILALKIAQEPPKTPSKTHLVARTRPDPENDSKMEPQTPQNEAPDTPFWIDFGADFKDFLRTSLLRFFVNLG